MPSFVCEQQVGQRSRPKEDNKLQDAPEDEDQKYNYILWKMVPPGRSKYFYSFGGETAEAETARDHHRIREAHTKIVKGIKCIEIDVDTM